MNDHTKTEDPDIKPMEIIDGVIERNTPARNTEPPPGSTIRNPNRDHKPGTTNGNDYE